MGLFHRHRWIAISAKEYHNSQYHSIEGKWIPFSHETSVAYECYCGKLKSETIRGEHGKRINAEIEARKTEGTVPKDIPKS